MTTRDIISKLTRELKAGIETEAQAVYMLAGARKIIERDKIGSHYPDLKFHCDWALHSKLEGPAAQKILGTFDAAHALLRGGTIRLRDLSAGLGEEIHRISKMRSFEEELSRFLEVYGLPSLMQNRPDGWAHFLHLYAGVVEDIPLVVTGAAAHISHVTVHLHVLQETIGGERLFQVAWRIHDRNGQSGAIFGIYSFTQ